MTEPFRLTARTPAGKIRYAMEQLNGVYAQDSAGQTKLIAVRLLLDRVADELDAQPEFPPPIRPDGSHHYVSTSCTHDDHERCRKVCKFCPAECACDCGHPVAGPATPETAEQLHARGAHPGFEYRRTEGPRKQWDYADQPPYDEHGDPDPTWERNTAMGRDGWERFDYTEESYWRRPLPTRATPDIPPTSGDAPDIEGERQ